MKILKDYRIIDGSSVFIMDDYYANYCKTIYGEEDPILTTDNYIDLDFVKNNNIEMVVLHNKNNPVDVLTFENSLLKWKNKSYDIEVLKLIAKNSTIISLMFGNGLCGQVEYGYKLLLNDKYQSENYILLIDEDHPSLDWLLID